jgi:tetratricopeptide (TPR) repeat protein
VVVAPVGVGFGQQALALWAQRNHRRVVRAPSDIGREACLLIPQRRRELESVHLAPDEGLFLHEADLTYTRAEWLGAFDAARVGYAEESYRLSQGWPEGLLVALQLSGRQEAVPLLHHPLAQAHLGRFIPRDVPRDTLSRLASSPVLIPELYGFLQLTPDLVAELYDRGLLYATDQGYCLPALLRRALQRPLQPEWVLELAGILRSRRLHAPALEVLGEHGFWEAYLELLVETYVPRAGVRVLRERLDGVPPGYRGLEAYQYLTALLRRSSGDIEGAIRQLEGLSQTASPRLRLWLTNALGVAYGLRGDYPKAVEHFEAGLAQAQTSLIQGHLLQNLGVALLHLQRYREGAESLTKAVHTYRSIGASQDEACGIENLIHAKVFEGYPLLALAEIEQKTGVPSPMVHNNTGRAYIMLGELEKARQALSRAKQMAEDTGVPRSSAYAEVILAQVALLEGQFDLARSLADRVIGAHQEAGIRGEAHLVRSQLEFQHGNLEAARAELALAAGIPFGHKTEAVRQGVRPLEPTLEEAREAGAMFEVAQLLMLKGDVASLREALGLCRQNGYGLLLKHPFYSHHWLPLIKADPSCWTAFPLTIQTFGGFRVSFLGKTLSLAEFPTRKTAALLLALALQARPQNREGLAERFWGGLEHPLDSLQTAVSKLRSLLFPQLIGSSKSQLSLNFPVVLDYPEFVKQARALLEAPEVGLEDFIQRHSEPWLPEMADLFPMERSEVERYQLELWAMVAEQQQARSSLAVVAYWHALALDPYSERAWQGLIAAYERLDEPQMAAEARRSMAQALRELRE